MTFLRRSLLASSSRGLLRRRLSISPIGITLDSSSNNNIMNISNINIRNSNTTVLRSYSSTPMSLLAEDGSGSAEEGGDNTAAIAAAKEAAERKAVLRRSSLEYNQTKAAYNRSVGKLRHHYQAEHARHEARDAAERDAAVAVTTRRRLEKQRAKNERSFQNQIRQEELRKQQAAAFEDHLQQQQEIRTASNEIHHAARQLLVEELEVESGQWLTSADEVTAAFDDPETEQKLWARPQGVLGVPNPSLDSHFWTYEGHTWDRSKTYKTRSQILLQQLEEEAYIHTNVDYDTYWTEEKLAAADAKDQKAKLRATVRTAGRRALLQRQKDYMAKEQEDNNNNNDGGEPPKAPPIPSLGVLGNVAAQEKEGAEILLKDPTKFFVFADDGGNQANNDGDDAATGDDGGEPSSYAGSSLGVPVAIRDPLRTGQPQGRVFPIPVGKLPKPDLRTEKEKKRQEREERLWAAAGKASADGGEGEGKHDEDLLVAEEDRVIGEAVDYEEASANWDSDDEDWNKGLDADLDKDLLQLPRELRYRHEDLDVVIEKLEAKARTHQSHVQNTIRNMEQEARSRLDRTEDETAALVGDGDAADVAATANESDAPFFDAATTAQLRSVGADVDKYERLMSSLTHEQLLSMFALEGAASANSNAESSNAATEDGDAALAAGSGGEAARTQVFEGIPGLSGDQIAELTELESFIRVAETEKSSSSLP